MSDHTPPDDRPTGPAAGAHPDIDELSAYSAGELAGADAVRVADHVASCADCAADVATLEAVGRELAALPPVTMPEDVAARLDDAVRRERARPAVAAVARPARQRRDSSWMGVAAGIAALVIGVGALATLAGGGGDEDTAATSGRVETGATGAATVAAEAETASPSDNASLSPRQLDEALSDVPILKSGTNYSGEQFSSQVLSAAATADATDTPAPAATRSRLTSRDVTATASASADGWSATAAASPTGPATEGATGGQSRTLLEDLGDDPKRLAACVRLLTGGEPAELVSVDLARFDNRPAATLVFRGSQPDTFEVYVVRADCGASGRADEDPQLYFEVVKSR